MRITVTFYDENGESDHARELAQIVDLEIALPPTSNAGTVWGYIEGVVDARGLGVIIGELHRSRLDNHSG
jgi:hypothetical protein